jgi:hypothetical protein
MFFNDLGHGGPLALTLSWRIYEPDGCETAGARPGRGFGVTNHVSRGTIYKIV